MKTFHDNSSSKVLKIFIAGSKALSEQRKSFRAILMRMQTLWKVMIEAKTFEDFSSSLTETGRQEDYNNYIANEADIVAFIFDSTVGGITIQEFEVAYDCFKQKRRPEILVYCRTAKGEQLSEIEVLKQKLNQLNQYYTEYSDNDKLEILFKDDVNRYLVEYYKAIVR